MDSDLAEISPSDVVPVSPTSSPSTLHLSQMLADDQYVETPETLPQLLQLVTRMSAELAETKEELKKALDHTKEPTHKQNQADIRKFLSAIEENSTSNKKVVWEKDLPKLAKLVKVSIFEPLDERMYEDTLYDWECKAKGNGMDEAVLKHLVLHIGYEKILHALEGLDIPALSWRELKDQLACKLFPYSRYRLDLEKEMVAVDRTKPIDKAILLLTKQRKRHTQLCERWKKPNAMLDDSLKEALLCKLPAQHVTACISTKAYQTFTFDQFADYCEMVMASVEIGEKAKGNLAQNPRSSPPIPSKIDVAAVKRPRVAKPLKPSPKPAPPEYKCFNCDGIGHFMRNCPHPKVRCSVCNRMGHRAEACTRLQHAGPLGRTRTGFLRITRGGIHLDLVDEATKRALFDSMKQHLEGQEKAYDVAKAKAKQKRDEKRAEELIEGLEETEIPIDSEMVQAVRETPIQSEMPAVVPTLLSASQKTPSHYLDIGIVGKKFPALLDSGAAVSLLPSSIWENIPNEEKNLMSKTSPGLYPLTGLGGLLDVVLIVELPIEAAGRTLLQRFFVTSEPYYPILGMDALQNLGLQIDFSSGNIYIHGDAIPIQQSDELGMSPLCAEIQTPEIEVKKLQFKMGIGSLPGERELAEELFSRHPEVWQNPRSGTCNTTLHHIDTGDATPIRSRVRRLPPEKVEEVKRQIQTLTDSGAIRSSNSPWASPIVLVPKANGTTRLCVDYRALNKVTRKDAFPLPRITELLDRLATAKVFTTIDLAAGFHQIPLDESSIQKTAFITPDGLYEYKVLPFGLANAPSTFQRMTDALFRDPPLCYNVAVYIDDIVVHTPDFEGHLSLLEKTLNRLKKAGLFINLNKTTVLARKAKYLGFIVEAGEVTPDPNQTLALANLEPPKDVHGVRRFLGLTGYFRHFVPYFSTKVLPLTALLKKNVPFIWTSECQKAWKNLKEELGHTKVRLALPLNGYMFVLDTDASNKALGAVLMQQVDAHLRPIAYASRTLTPTERNWTTREQEAYAIVWAVLHFAPYLRAQPHFIIRTDHQSLRWLWKADNKRIIRWALLLQEFNFAIEYSKGGSHVHADIFTRDLPSDSSVDAQVERVAVKPRVFAISESKVCHEIPPFPSFEELIEAQDRECTPSLIAQFKLKKGHQGAYQPMNGQQVYVPASLRRNIMYYYHYGSMGAHQGVNKAFSRIRKLFWWPGLRDDLQDYHNHCLTCARRRPKPPTQNRGYLLASAIGDVVAMDIIGPIETLEGPKNILTVIDHFSRYAHAIVLTEITAKEIWTNLFQGWISYFGVPIYILSDNATVFRSQELKKQFAEFGVKSMHSFPYHPEGNGIVESFHIFLKRALIASLRLTKWTVQQSLSTALMAYRSTPHIATGETPYFLLTGVDMMLPGLQDWTERPPLEEENRQQMLSRLREEAFEFTARRAVERAASKSSKTKGKSILPGTLVLTWMSTMERHALGKQIGTSKLTPLWTGPYRIIREQPNRKNTYVIRKLGGEQKTKVVSGDMLIVIPGRYENEEAKEALGELIADFRRPRTSTGELRSTETPLQQRRAQHFTSAGETERLLDQLQAETTEPVLEASDIKDQMNQTGNEELSSEDPPRKRTRTVHCVRWDEILSNI